jgi:hypothetical protein
MTSFSSELNWSQFDQSNYMRNSRTFAARYLIRNFDTRTSPSKLPYHQTHPMMGEIPFQPLLLDTGRQFATIPSLFPNRPQTIAFLKDSRNQIHKINTNVQDVNPYFKMQPFNYPSVRLAFLHAGFKRVIEDDWNVFFGRHLPVDMYPKLNAFQKTNHFPGSIHLGRKDLLSAALQAMKKIFKTDYDFFPDTYLMPYDRDQLLSDIKSKPMQYFITKPNAGSCGRGIKVIRGDSEMPTGPCVVQNYIHNPFLIDGFKFDLRLYVAVTSYDPLRIYLYPEGLVRFSTEKYDLSNLDSRLAHLTNFSLNKFSKKFVANDDVEEDDKGQKWSVSALKRYMETHGVDHVKIWDGIEDVIIKTLLSVENTILKKTETLRCQHKSFFEIYGFDVLIDENMKPHLLEVNILPSLGVPSPLDKKIKISLLQNTLHMSGVTPFNRSMLEEETAKLDYLPKHIELEKRNDIYSIQDAEDELNRIGEFKRIYPPQELRKYNRLYETPRHSNEVLAKFEENKRTSKKEELYKKILLK